jgi:hypothetical protein
MLETPELEMTNNVPIGARVERELLVRVREEARRNRRLLGQEIASLLEEALLQRERERRQQEQRERAERPRTRFEKDWQRELERQQEQGKRAEHPRPRLEEDFQQELRRRAAHSARTKGRTA